MEDMETHARACQADGPHSPHLEDLAVNILEVIRREAGEPALL